MRSYDTVGVTKDGLDKLKFTDNEFSDIIFSLGKVYFSEQENGEPKLHFNYEIHMQDASVEFNKNKFEDELAEFIVERIRLGIENNDLVYTGGIDED